MMGGMAEAPGLLQGKLLVAQPSLIDPNFSRTAIFLLAHSEQGALGLVLNRPSVTPLGVPLPEWEGLASGPAVVFVGGPVSEGTICLARVKPEIGVPGSSYLPLEGALGTLDLEAGADVVAPWVDRLRVFAGYAGWSPGQLEDEIAEGAWWALSAQEDDIFDPRPTSLWKRALRRQGNRLALVSALPPDPSLN
jgi:putative transcriptional regulator